MKPNKILPIFILTAILLVSLTSAVVYETNYIYDGNTEKAVTGVSVIGYICDNSDCSAASQKLWTNVQTAGDTNKIVLQYPTELKSEYGYVVYFFKPGYFPYKITADWEGNGNTPKSYKNYLYKMSDTAYAPIENFEISDTSIKTGEKVTITADILSPRINKDNIQFIPAELKNDYYSDKVKLTLEVNGNAVETKNLNMLWSTEKNIEFNWTPSAEGTYKIKLITEITDDKFLNTETKTEEKTIVVTKEIKDTTSPVITIIAPENGKTYNKIITYFHFSVYDKSSVSCKYSTDNGKTKNYLDCNAPFIKIYSEKGTNTWTIYAIDSYGNSAEKSVTFRIDLYNGDIDGNGRKDTNNNGYKQIYTEDSLEQIQYYNQFDKPVEKYFIDDKKTAEKENVISNNYYILISAILFILIIFLIYLISAVRKH